MALNWDRAIHNPLSLFASAAALDTYPSSELNSASACQRSPFQTPDATSRRVGLSESAALTVGLRCVSFRDVRGLRSGSPAELSDSGLKSLCPLTRLDRKIGVSNRFLYANTRYRKNGTGLDESGGLRLTRFDSLPAPGS